MGLIKDTTNNIDTSMLFKSKLTKNFSNENYWIESYQNKINNAWAFATDVVDIQEEIELYNNNGYRKAIPTYQNIEVRITSAYDEKGTKLSDDYKNIIFKDVKHNQLIGRKYFFDVKDFTQSDKSQKCTWLNVNFDTVHLGQNAIIRRCNGNLGFLIEDNTKEWYEPVILEYDPKYTINYYSNVLNVVKSELYAVAQFNEYTKNIQVNDRFILGALDFDNISNNAVYKVKELFKFDSEHTANPNSIPLIVLALDRDIINPQQDLIQIDALGNMHYIADYYLKNTKDNNKNHTTIFVEDEDNILQNSEGNILSNVNQEYYLKITPNNHVIYEGDSIIYSCYVYDSANNQMEEAVDFSFELSGTNIPNSYYSYNMIDDNNVQIINLHKYFKSDLILKCTTKTDKYNTNTLSFTIQLGDKL